MAAVSDSWAQLLTTVRRRRQGDLDDAEREAALREVMSLGCLSVPGTVDCSLTMQVSGGRFTTEATCGSLATELDDVQYGSDDGPCLSAARNRRRERIDTMSRDQRWPVFSRRAVDREVHSSLSVPVIGHQALLALNFYGRGEFGFRTARSEQLAGFVARVAAALLPAGIADEAEGTEATSARQAWVLNAEVKRAQSVIMEREGLSATVAYRMLALHSSARSQPLAMVVRDVLADEDRDVR